MVQIIGILEQWKRKSQVNKHLLNKQDGDLLQGQY